MSGDQEQTSFILFTDIYRSSALWEKYPNEFSQALEEHNCVVEQAVESRGGEIMKNLGDGYIALFDTASVCVSAMVDVERGMGALPALPDDERVRLRVAGHGGPLKRLAVGKGYFGHALNRASRIVQVCHPGQALVSQVVRAHTGEAVDGAKLTDLGSHHLRDLAEPERLYQLDHPEFALHEFPPLPTLEFRPNNLVYQPNAFIGRAREHGELKELILEKNKRLITLTAPGGYGKSRLATQLCANLLDFFENGVFEVLLAPVGSHERIVTTTAAALGFQFYGRAEPKSQLIDYLREKQMLISFDNFEHVMEGKDLLAEILQHAPKVSLLVTSREPLRLKAEKVYKLAPLPVAVTTGVGTRQVPGVGTRHPTGVGTSVPTPPNLANEFASPVVAETEIPEAAQLFVDRATLVKHDFSLTEKNLATVNEICAKLDGVPLAVELAAAWADSFTLPELLSEVERQLELTAKMTDVPARQRSIRASLDWSYNLLTEEQREVIRAVSTFRGGFFFEAAECVVGRGLAPRLPENPKDGAIQVHPPSAAPEATRVRALQKNLRNLLSQLSDKGWLFTREMLAKTRFFVRDTATHQYAFEKLKQNGVGTRQVPGVGTSVPTLEGGQASVPTLEGGQASVPTPPNLANEFASPGVSEYESRVLAHAGYFAELIEREGERLKGHGQMEALKILGVELENIYEAIDTCLKRTVGRPAAAADFGVGTRQVPGVGTRQVPGVGTSVPTLEGGQASVPTPPNLANEFASPAITGETNLRQGSGGQAPALPLLLPFAQHLESYLDKVSRWLEGLPWYERMLKHAEKLEDRAPPRWASPPRRASLQTPASLGLSRLLWRLSRYEEAEKEAKAARKLAEKAGDRASLATAVRTLGNVASDQGRYEEAEKLHRESLEIKREIGDRNGIATSLNNLGLVASGQGRYEEAEKLYQESLKIKREIGDRWGIASSLNNLGNVVHAQGRYDEAERLYRESLTIQREIGDRSGIAMSLNNLGIVASGQGRYEEAEKLHKESLDIMREIGDRRGIANSLNCLGIAAYLQGRYAEAEKLYYESLEIRREIGERSGIAMSLNCLGLAAYDQGRYAEAEKLYYESLEIRREIGERSGIAASLNNLGAAQAKQARFSEARNSLSEGIETAKEIGNPTDIICGAVVEGYLLADTGHFASSAVILTSAQHQAKEMKYKLEPMEQGMLDEGMAKLKDALSEEELAEAQARAEAMTLDELTDFALKALEELEV